MHFDLARTPFSRYGAYLSLSTDEKKTGAHLIIRNVRMRGGRERLFCLTFCRNGQPVPVTIVATPAAVTVTGDGGTSRLYLRGDTQLGIESRGLDVLAYLAKPESGFGMQEAERRTKFYDMNAQVFATFTVLRGRAIEQIRRDTWDQVEHATMKGLLLASGVDGALATLDVVPRERPPAPEPAVDVVADLAAVQAEWDAFAARMPAVPAARRSQAELAWYNLWSCVVRAEGFLAYDAMYMSKRAMCAMWTWDHCFNALALAEADLRGGLEQFLLPFALQKENGQIPDHWTVDEATWLITKPPVHGWCIRKLMAEHDIDDGTLRRIYRHLAKFTDWWFTYRDTDQDGFPNYVHGCDSGWDNSTDFDLGYGLEAPDLPAFLFLQMQALAEIADRLGRRRAAGQWRRRAARLLETLYAHAWNGDGFVPKLSRTHTPVAPSTSLLSLMPLVLGEFLDKDKFACLVRRLEREFLTAYGPATEMPTSPKYMPDGYWRGPIWAPSTYLIVDGLRRGGRPDLAREVARRFCDLCELAGGNYENFDALTGQGLRDQGYTWTASVNLLLMHEYLGDPVARG